MRILPRQSRRPNSTSRHLALMGWCLLTWLVPLAAPLAACPFCSATSKTLSEEIESAQVVLLAKLLQTVPAPDPHPDDVGGFGPFDPDSGKAKFAVSEVLKGEDLIRGIDEIEVIFFGPSDDDRLFLVTGMGGDTMIWTTPLPLSSAAVDYIRKIPHLPETGADRLDFFQSFLEHEDPLLAQDAYDEFARAPYDVVKDLRDRMDHDQLVEWIRDGDVGPTRRRLYLTMLGVCGTEEDVPMLEAFIRSDYRSYQPSLAAGLAAGHSLGMGTGTWFFDELVKMDERRKKQGLDALIACYLTLQGADGLPLIAERFLSNPHAEYSYIYAAIMALRFHGESTDVLPREELLAAMRLLLDNPDFADQVVHDLSRWEDWSVLERLVGMFKSAGEDSFIRQPVVAYLMVCSEQGNAVGTRAAAALKELEELDPETVARAKSLMSFGYLARARAPAGETGDGADAAADTAAVGRDATAVEAEGAPNIEENGGKAALAADADDQAAAADPTPGTTGIGSQGVVTSTESDEPQRSSEESGVQASGVDSPADEIPAVAPTTEGTAEAASAAESATAEQLVPPSRLGLIGVPLLSSLLLTGLFWLILRGTG